ncbi:pisatin demethylase [Echria macrotheca]|uniref:Pisatin demethylase n=1 Tax=Echria macrotheca TaxID=438768 RepID=A0AAJ0F7Q8_9PEZI|nr:pisatin demethylase [Echria macrotheca]
MAVVDLATTHYQTLVAGALAVSLVLFWFIPTVRQYLRLRHIPGPFSSGFSKLWLLRGTLSGQLHLKFYEANQKYGSIARIAPNEVITSDPKLLRHILAVRSPYQRSDWYLALRFNPHRDNLITLLDDDEHTKLRAKMAAGYSGREVDNLEHRIDRNILALANLIATKYMPANKAFDFGRKAQYFTLDALSDIAFGRIFGFLASDSDMYAYLETMEQQLTAIAVSIVYPWIVSVVASPLFARLLPSHHDALGFGRIMGIARDTVAARFQGDSTDKLKHVADDAPRDMLGSFLAHGLTRDEAESEVLLQIIAGSDTTATAIRATALYLATNPRVLSRLRAELESTAHANRPWDEVISYADALKLPYLQAVIKEGLRIFPPATSPVPKLVPPSGDTWDGVYLPPGTKVGYCAWGVFRRPDVWGDDADEFRPERWLVEDGADPAKVKEMDATLDLHFGLGRWQCLGKGVAFMELNKIFVELFRRFDLAVLNPDKPWESRNTGLFIQSEFWMKATLREGIKPT